MGMADHIANRDTVLQSLLQELVGPHPVGEGIDCTVAIRLDDAKTAYLPYRQLGTGEEIIQRDSPTKRYGVGILYPREIPVAPEENEVQVSPTETETKSSQLESISDSLTDSAVQDFEKIAGRSGTGLSDGDSDDFDLSAANSFKQSSMAVSLLVHFPKGAKLTVSATGGRYSIKQVKLEGHDRDWWLRSPVRLSSRFDHADFSTNEARYSNTRETKNDNIENLDVRIELFARPQPSVDHFLITVCLVNRICSKGVVDLQSLFQSRIDIAFEKDSLGTIMPYLTAEPLDGEERSQELLYRDKVTFAVGHGCAADWKPGKDSTHAASVSAECLPRFETPSTTPDIRSSNGQPLVASMRSLARIDLGTDGFDQLETIVKEYEKWIVQQKERIAGLSHRLQTTAQIHMNQCSESAIRMRDGLSLLRDDPQIRFAFELANLAMLTQQVRSRREARVAFFDPRISTLLFKEPYDTLDLNSPRAQSCQWRAFQIAFILAALRSTADPSDSNRELVELIWFPTGGGKTEAYLGLAAFGVFLRRLRNPTDMGVHALMRYTLRLLTAQQFQRASRLVCAMEFIRRHNSTKLGDGKISIGIWLGGATTPNTCKDALTVLKSLTKGDGANENKFVLDRCPWCGAQMGPVNLGGKKGGQKGIPRVLGYQSSENTVVYKCPDSDCEFSDSLPLYVIDEDIYKIRPALVIGTVDKFARLAWKPQARALFGIAEDGTREYSPPGLIIQDELHLISGPLGSMVGLYEPVIEELCTDRRGFQPAKPKIISSTATIRSFEEQVRGLYARGRTSLFPPPGLDADDSFFARVARRPDGTFEPGRIFVGVHAPGLGSLQTVQVRTFSALLQAPQLMPKAERDPWWTLLLFFNSLRELGGALTLFQSDIPELLKGALRQRLGLGYSDVRKLWKVLELTGRLSGDEVPKALTALEVPTDSTQGHAVDVCLASNIIEVGVDIDRLSLMAVVGQPKTTSQYIQVTGRVGRKSDRPGLVVTLYSPSKPRDRSHFEKFRSYHERLYAQVEPTSVTPFSRPALDRALHAVIAGYVRQLGDSDQAKTPYPFPEALFAAAAKLLEDRASSVDPDELETLQRIIRKRGDEWQSWKRVNWSGTLQEENMPLLRPAGAYVTRDRACVSWSTPQSLRNVDAECQVEITQLYIPEEANDA